MTAELPPGAQRDHAALGVDNRASLGVGGKVADGKAQPPTRLAPVEDLPHCEPPPGTLTRAYLAITKGVPHEHLEFVENLPEPQWAELYGRGWDAYAPAHGLLPSPAPAQALAPAAAQVSQAPDQAPVPAPAQVPEVAEVPVAAPAPAQPHAPAAAQVPEVPAPEHAQVPAHVTAQAPAPELAQVPVKVPDPAPVPAPVPVAVIPVAAAPGHTASEDVRALELQVQLLKQKNIGLALAALQ